MKYLRIVVLLACALLALASATSQADTISLQQPVAYSTTPLTLQIDANSPISSPGYLRTWSIQGQTVHIEGCIPQNGFEVGSDYHLLFAIGTLPAGSYAAEYYVADCSSSGALLHPLDLHATLDFVVNAGAPPPIPTLNGWMIFALIAFIAAAALHSGRWALTRR
jgi:hypothetical protein